MTEEAKSEKLARMHLTLWAYAYEIASNPIVPDAEYDELAASINVEIETDDAELDDFFRDHYTKDSGYWIHKHPRLGRVKAIYESIKRVI